VSVEIWWQDEARIGQKNKITRRWAKKGTQPRGASETRRIIGRVEARRRA